MSVKTTLEQPNLTSVDLLNKELNDLAQPEIWNGYLIVKEGKLAQTNLFESIFENLKSFFGFDNKVDGVESKMFDFLISKESEIKFDWQIMMVKTLAKKVGISDSVGAEKPGTPKAHRQLEYLVNFISNKSLHDHKSTQGPKSTYEKSALAIPTEEQKFDSRLMALYSLKPKVPTEQTKIIENTFSSTIGNQTSTVSLEQKPNEEKEKEEKIEERSQGTSSLTQEHEILGDRSTEDILKLREEISEKEEKIEDQTKDQKEELDNQSTDNLMKSQENLKEDIEEKIPQKPKESTETQTKDVIKPEIKRTETPLPSFLEKTKGKVADEGIMSTAKKYVSGFYRTYVYDAESKTREIIENALNDTSVSKLRQEQEKVQEFINYSKNNLEAVLDTLEKIYSEKLFEREPLTQEQIDKLFSSTAIIEWQNQNDVDALRKRLNEDTPINQMILEAVRKNCFIRFQKIGDFFKDYSIFMVQHEEAKTLYEDLMSNQVYGLRAFINLSRAIVLEQINTLKDNYKDNKNLKDLAAFLEIKVWDEPVKRSQGDAKIRPIIEEALISTPFDFSYGLREGEFRFVEYAKGNLTSVLKTVEEMHEETPFVFNDISRLMHPKLTENLQTQEDIEALQDHLNKDNSLNAKILKVYSDDCRDKIRKVLRESERGKNIEKELEPYTRVSYDLVLELLKEFSVDESYLEGRETRSKAAVNLYNKILAESKAKG